MVGEKKKVRHCALANSLAIEWLLTISGIISTHPQPQDADHVNKMTNIEYALTW